MNDLVETHIKTYIETNDKGQLVRRSEITDFYLTREAYTKITVLYEDANKAPTTLKQNS